jgi:hypothetical protein
MSDPAENTTPPPPDKPVPRRRKHKRRRHVATGEKVVPLKVPAEFAGMTELECPAECNIDRCCISGMNVCTHPFKGGLQPALAGNADVMRRYDRARKVLAHRKIDLTGGG